MKTLNLTLLAIGGAFVFIMGLALIAEQFFPDKQSAMMVVAPIAMLTGLSARRIAEKLLGYTLLEAMKEDRNDAGN